MTGYGQTPVQGTGVVVSIQRCGDIELAHENALADNVAFDTHGFVPSPYAYPHVNSDVNREAVLNLRMARDRVQLVWDSGMGASEELADALADIDQAIRYLTGEEVPS